MFSSDLLNYPNLLDTHHSKLTQNRVSIPPETLDCIISNVSGISSVIERMNAKLPNHIPTWHYLLFQLEAIRKMVNDNLLRDKLKKLLEEFNNNSQAAVADWQVNDYLDKNSIDKFRASVKDTHIKADEADWLLCCLSLSLLPYIKMAMPFDAERERQTNMLIGVYDLQMSTLPEILLKLACGKSNNETKFTNLDLAIIKNTYSPCANHIEKCLLH